jgi:hypothetical protein
MANSGAGYITLLLKPDATEDAMRTALLALSSSGSGDWAPLGGLFGFGATGKTLSLLIAGERLDAKLTFGAPQTLQIPDRAFAVADVRSFCGQMTPLVVNPDALASICGQAGGRRHRRHRKTHRINRKRATRRGRR